MSNDNLLELQGSLLHKKKILFINHEQTLTGAPRVLKDIISLLSLNDAYELAVVSLKEGNAPWTQPFHRNWSQVPGDTDEAKAMFLSHEINPDLVFANTIESVPVAILFKEIPKIAYIHERDHLIKRAEKIPLSLLQQFADVWVVCDDAQKLLAAHGVFAHRVEYALDISGEDFLNHARGNYFVSVGTICARKGIDRFLEIASRMPEYSFVWVGDISTSKIILPH